MMFNQRIQLICGTSPAFEPVIKKTEIHPEGAIFARGACDDKGQMYHACESIRSNDEIR